MNAADTKHHIEESFRAKLLSFAIHRAEGVPEPKQNAQTSGTERGLRRKRRSATYPVDKTVLMHPEPRRVGSSLLRTPWVRLPSRLVSSPLREAHLLQFVVSGLKTAVAHRQRRQHEQIERH